MRYYDANYHMRQVSDDSESRGEIIKRMSEEISAEIQRLVNNRPVPVIKKSEGYARDEQDRDEHTRYGTVAEAERWFYNRNPIQVYQPRVECNSVAVEQVVRYINDHDAFIAEEATQYLVLKARYINYHLWAFEESRKQYVVLESTPGEHHTRRAIADALQNDAKKITIHLLKDGKSFEGKITASTLRNTRDYSYSSWNLDAADRNHFEKLYGRREDIFPRDILKITYGKKTLFEQGVVS